MSTEKRRCDFFPKLQHILFLHFCYFFNQLLAKFKTKIRIIEKKLLQKPTTAQATRTLKRPAKSNKLKHLNIQHLQFCMHACVSALMCTCMFAYIFTCTCTSICSVMQHLLHYACIRTPPYSQSYTHVCMYIYVCVDNCVKSLKSCKAHAHVLVMQLIWFNIDGIHFATTSCCFKSKNFV